MLSRRKILTDAGAALTAFFAAAYATTVKAQGQAQGTLAQARGALGQAPPATSCTLTPVTSEGPFYFDPKLVRSDITENQPGVVLTLGLRVVSADTCKPIPKARVDLWHADAKGLYSGYGDQHGSGASRARSAKGKTWLRGTQFTNADGFVSFRTIYPSWYRGRTPHIHYKILLEPREVAVSQLYFPDKVSDQIYTSSKDYVPRKPGRDTFNENDMYLRGGRTQGAFCDVTNDGSGADSNYSASVVIGIAQATA
jgi:protocatechuate 3,4-dioxygenase beta subunit